MTDRFHVTERGKLKKQVHDLTTELDGQKEVRAEMLAALKVCVDQMKNAGNVLSVRGHGVEAFRMAEKMGRETIARAEAGA